MFVFKANVTTKNRKEVVRKSRDNIELMMSERCEGRRALS
jgi:hypothetical protein